MTSEAQPTFTCKVCARELTPRFLPSTAPNCPSCGADTAPNQAAIDAALTVFCPNCHANGTVYESDECPDCGSAWGHWSGSESVEQAPGSAAQDDRVLYKSTRGPEGGTVPRWKIV
ncbi:MAG: hypothetical protein QF357_02650 [Dehalococcoidia bacterium]|jgi:DnaJ-class molecular chaperone|nr:hypothetical protein [Dehalococcoidia bacterium]